VNLHAQMAHSPTVLTAYTSLRAVLTEHTTFDPKVAAALMLATAAGVGNGYMIRIASRLEFIRRLSSLRVIKPPEPGKK
jgi:hypothetical protein